MIATENLTKEYQGRRVVNQLNLRVHAGEIYGFLGPNGAGKSTTIGMILGQIPITRGKAKLFGKLLNEDYFSTKQRIGVVGEFQHLYKEMTAFEYLSFFAELYAVKDRARRIMELLDRVELAESGNLALKAFSKGMQQKLSLARALLHDPDLLILDEPVSSLDPQGIKQVRDLILAENQRGKTVFISSHLLSEIEKTCHRIGIINHGCLVAEGSLGNIINQLGSETIIEIELEEEINEAVIDSLGQLPFIAKIARPAPRLLRLHTQGAADQRSTISKHLTGHGYTVVSMKKNQMSLEEAFVTITENNISLLTGAKEKP